jgi:uncharacterized protein YjbI with pentapeptide repeats
MRWYAPSRLDALAPVDLEGVALVPRPADWRSHEVARDAFRDNWCDRKDHGQTACADFIAEHGDDFEAALDAERTATLDNLPRLLLNGADLRAARLLDAFAPHGDLTNARLEGAVLWQTRLEGADLREARLKDASLNGARLEGADLAHARLEGAVLWGAQLEGVILAAAELKGADLRGARLEGADLREARLEGADLGYARLEGAVLQQARLDGADLAHARLEGAFLRETSLEAANLWEAQLEGAFLIGARLKGAVLSAADFTGTTLNQGQIAGAIGDADTVLPRDAETGAQLYVWSCWEEPPPTLDQTLATSLEFMHQLLRERWLCNGRRREQVGRPAPEPEESPENGSAAAPAQSP